MKQWFVYGVAALKNKFIKWFKNFRGSGRDSKKDFQRLKKKKKCFHDNLPGFCNRFGRRLGDIFETSIKSNLKKITVPPSPLFLGCHSKNCGSGSYFWLQSSSSNSHCFCSFCFTSLLLRWRILSVIFVAAPLSHFCSDVLMRSWIGLIFQSNIAFFFLKNLQ